MRELERTYLAKTFPKGLRDCKSEEIIDIYVPKSSEHPKIRIRKRGDSYKITKKEPLDKDPSHLKEQTITLTESEFKEFMKLDGKRTHKTRYHYDHGGRTAEIDVFQGDLKGLVLVDFEFRTPEEKDSFKMPDFCLVEVTQNKTFAGGMLCGKSYEDIEKELERLDYSRIFLE